MVLKGPFGKDVGDRTWVEEPYLLCYFFGSSLRSSGADSEPSRGASAVGTGTLL